MPVLSPTAESRVVPFAFAGAAIATAPASASEGPVEGGEGPRVPAEEVTSTEPLSTFMLSVPARLARSSSAAALAARSPSTLAARAAPVAAFRAFCRARFWAALLAPPEGVRAGARAPGSRDGFCSIGLPLLQLGRESGVN